MYSYLKMLLFSCSNDHHKALDILLKDLKVFANRNEVLFKDLSYFLIAFGERYRKKEKDCKKKLCFGHENEVHIYSI